jgi:hypothetical protein
LVSVVWLATSNKATTNNKRSVQMRAKRMLMGAAVIGCLAATMPSGAYAQEANSRDQINARAGQQPASNVRPNGPMRQGQGSDRNAQFGAHANNSGTPANGQLERRGVASESRMRAAAAESRRFAVQRGMRSERLANRNRSVDVGTVDAGVGVAAADYGYRGRRLYAYAPTYEAGYARGPYYNYAPGYAVAASPGPYYTPGWNVAYAGPYYDYAPGVSVGIGIGPVGIGLGPAWAW